jgi:EAL domain-containing protein (putative c-di-GMP-specific phosphodiesterase class I)
MYEVKHSGRDSYKLFQPKREVQGTQKAELGETLAGAVTRGEFDLRFQPQTNVEGNITGAEALLRWNHPKFGLLTPDMFIGLAEQNGTIAELNRFVIEKAVTVLRDWASKPEGAKLTLSVNLGGEQLLRADFARELRSLLRTSGIRAGALVLELTEQMLSTCRGDASKILAQLKTTGVSLSLDDFGAGYTSLASLKDMPVDEIKIDGRFVKAMATGKKDMAIVKSILALASALGMTAVAEHVETQAQEELLIDEGCSRFQGFLYGGALSRADFELMVGIGSYEAGRKVA